jgi:hypothetical protein
VEKVKSGPYAPLSHPFFERSIVPLGREFLGRTLFWNADDLENKLADLQSSYNNHRIHSTLGGNKSQDKARGATRSQAALHNIGWRGHCRGIYQLPATP